MYESELRQNKSVLFVGIKVVKSPFFSETALEKKKELDRSCAEECAKGFCENLRNLSKRFYEKVSSCEKKLEDLKSTR